MKKRIVIGISGASGVTLGIRMLDEICKHEDWESHLIVTDGARKTIEVETGYSFEDVSGKADFFYDNRDIGANLASGTFETTGMIIAPCSMKTLAGISSGYSDNLLLRAADVSLKERRQLVLLARETPLNPIHLRNMLNLSEMGAVIMPPVLSYYNNPVSIDDMSDHIVGKCLRRFGINHERFKVWDSGNVRIGR